MERVHAVAAMQARADAARAAGRRLALVPTMGALHEGHLALVEEAKRRADHVTVSVFVNPTQFAPGEDYARYPRTLDADVAALEAAGGVDVVFAPDAAAMYPFGLPPFTTVRVRDLDRHLCGAFRPGHFEGVTTVVAKLFLACRPHVAVFGEKDAQQLAIVRRMTAELGFGVEVVGHPIVREADGLALSSRNRYLSDEERRQAVVLSEAVAAARAAAEAGERRAPALVDAMRRAVARAPLARLQYAEVVDAETLQPVEALVPGRYLAALAVFFGSTRLIDNVTIAIGD
ncbi:MAG TPA: pantoate--beta-alanine ligase [Rubricoccaceae bacterium]|nr:pantoate--beta-alanine ligase [Rubricoccaceae bacterium]